MSWLFFGLMAWANLNNPVQLPPAQGKPPVDARPQIRRIRPPRAYLSTYFVGNGESGIFLATSDDGLRFRPLIEPNIPILKSTLGANSLSRDPCVIYGPDQRWHMVWTSGWWKRTLGLAHSRDLVHWTQQVVPAMVDIPNALNAWAPEISYDPKTSKYIIYWSSTVTGRFSATARPDGDVGPENEPLNHRFFFTQTSDFKNYSPSRLLWDPGFNCIDASMRLGRDGWQLFGKNETRSPTPAKYLFMATAPGPLGPFHMACPRITGDFWAEGPTAIRVDQKLRVYFDRYTEGKWGAVESSDLKTWDDISDKIQMVPGARHGTIIVVPKGVVNRIRENMKREHSEPQ